jgi:outer membrane biosynthesis protein TonB
MIRAISVIFFSAVLVVFLMGSAMAQGTKPEHPATTEQPKTEKKKAEHPKAEEKKAEEKKAEHPKAEEKKAEEKKAEHPK